MIIIDLSGLALSAEEKEILTHPLLYGVILFSRNYENKVQLKNLIAEIRTINPNLLISVDQEGGRVQRFKEGFTRLPAMRILGNIYQQDINKAERLAKACGYVLAYELLALGIDLSFTPVADIDYGHNNVIGDRAFSHKPKTIIALASALIDGMHEAGMACVIKHFPGHGFVRTDSHLALAIDKRMIIQMQNDLAVFKALLPKADALMPSHIIYNRCDVKPAGFSKFWLQTLLRKKYDYSGVIISDDLSMGAAVAFEPDLQKRIYFALNSGCDIVLVCKQFSAIKAILPSLARQKIAINLSGERTKSDKIIYQDYLANIQTIL